MSKEEYVEKIVNGKMKLEDFVAEHFELKEKYNNTKTSLDNILKEYDVIFENFKILENMYDKLYSDAKPYKFEDLKVGMWVWDSKEERCSCIENFAGTWQIYFCNYTVLFEENRFFPVQCANVRCE